MEQKPNLDFQRQKAEQIVSEKFSASFMNNSKWVKLLNTLVENFRLVDNVSLKLVWDENLRELNISEYSTYNFDYYENAMEAMVTGTPKGWYGYSEIEWIEFSKNAYDLASVLNSVAKFEYTISENKLRLFAYK